jgi:hypothetical protein
MKLPTFPVEGGCQCRAVRYRIKGVPRGIYVCHCKDCQRSSGAAFSMTMVMNASDVELISGKLVGFDKAADSGRTVRMLGCAECGTKIWNEPLANPQWINVKPGTLDDPTWARPVGNIWTDRALPWIAIDDRGPNFPLQPPSRQPLLDAFAAEVAKG